ncbi:site-specific DNA-methyltransferase [Flavobacterium sp. SM2513]|uniref:site-specific DNA-methyltransferase n=1 Tax=Flavobacterium sp. SM2513 TaxID=3424766 RepID=UPI003D7FA9FE
MNNDNSIKDLKYFLKEMFQFNENDLDFGIYKIYNLKRKNIEGFIDGDGENDLTPTIEKILEEVNLENQKSDSIDLFNFLKGINKESLLSDPDSNYSKIQMAFNFEDDEDKKQELQDTLDKISKSSGLTEELKDKIYNHILGFFQMYYSNGDFGYNDRSRDVYKVPYEADYDGTDTMFHWKHKGSLYIKTGTSFNAIKFQLNGKKIEYRLETNTDSENESASRNNNKDSQLKHYQFSRIEKIDDTYQVIFNLAEASTSKVDIFKAIYNEVISNDDISKYLEYTKADKNHTVFIDLGKDFDKVQNGQIKGLSSLRQSKEKVEKEAKNNFERGVKLYDDTKKEFTDDTLKILYKLDQKLNSFYIGNDADYFIHENLEEFLTNEKQRFVKNYIFDDLESIYNGKLDNTTLLIAKAFDKVTSRIIEFLSAIEEFQKHLFTKKKKVVESEYCITLDYVNEKHFKAILLNNAQLQEWKDLFGLEIKTVADLKLQPTLVLDTKFFRESNGSNTLKDTLLNEIDGLDAKTNGLLFNSENFQALELLQIKFKEKIKTIYIDPPYNTGGDGFVYKDNFRHSSWVTFIQNRVSLAKNLLNSKGVFFTSLDDNESKNFISISNEIFKTQKPIANFIWKKKGTSTNVEGAYVSALVDNTFTYGEISGILPRTVKAETRNHPLNDKDGNYRLTVIEKKDSGSYKRDTMKFEIIGHKPRSGKRWQIGELTARALEKKNRFVFDDNKIKLKIYDFEETDTYSAQPNLLLELGSSDTASKYVNEALFGISEYFSNPKPIELLNHLINITSDKNTDYILDFCAGSGTTGDSSIRMNRRYILCEMGLYFNKITKPRIKKIIFSKNWENAKPINNSGFNKHIFKYQVLEQYEDVLDNLQVFDGILPENLPLKYLYKPEINSLDNNLDIFNPFDNKIKYGQPSQEGFIDLVETFNYIQGYFIQSIKTYTINTKYYKVVETTNGVLVIWREITLDEDDSKSILEIVGKYSNIHTVEVNAHFATLQLDKHNNLKVGDNELELQIIQKEIFNQ